jgi:dihydrofolate reductase
MRTIVLTMQTTLNNRIAMADGSFWEPLVVEDAEQAYINEVFSGSDTWVMSRPVFEVVQPWWDMVARGQLPDDVPAISDVQVEFGRIFAGLRRVVISRSTVDGADALLSGDIAAGLEGLRREQGSNIMLSAGPSVVDPLLRAGLVGRIVQPIHPRVLHAGPQLYGEGVDLLLRLNRAMPWPSGTVTLDYDVRMGD